MLIMETSCKSLFDTRSHVVSRLSDAGFETKLAVSVEQSILNYTKETAAHKFKISYLRWSNIQVRRLYLRKFRSILHNAGVIKTLIDEQTIEPLQVAAVDHYTLAPHLYAEFFEKKRQREMYTALADTDDAYDGILKCDSCSSMKTRYVEVQTRSADEPMTVFARCMNCGVHWTLDGK
jgi:DNA-directed RNA polymerase subunit M/transcription elongation factor TFIIS